jgi:hypothetical protein
MGCEVVLSGSYPGWTNTESEIMDVLVPIWKQTGEKPSVSSLSCWVRVWDSWNQLP